MRVLVAQINPTIGDLSDNTNKIIESISQGKVAKADIVLFSELALTGYPPKDFLLLPHFIAATEDSLKKIALETKGIVALVGIPRRFENKLYNSVAVIMDGEIIGYQDKQLLPTYDVFDEKRYFEPGEDSKVWIIKGKKIGITICEDVWQYSGLLKNHNYTNDPIKNLISEDLDLLLNLSASPYSLGKKEKRIEVLSKAAKALHCPILFCNQIGGNDGLIFDGYSLYMGKNGQLKAIAKGFKEDHTLFDLFKEDKIKQDEATFLEEPIQDLYQALVLGVRDYFHKSGFKKACLGLSGGIDSAVVACIAAEALGKENILGVIMPSRYSSEGSMVDAKALIDHLDISFEIISIEKPFEGYLNLLTPYFQEKPSDYTEENLQARIRGMILMALSNKHGYIVLSTGNKSELAMGYATLYGDTCGGLAVISDVSKSNVYQLAKWINRKKEIIPLNTITKPPSAELRPNQKDSDSLPDYEIIDCITQQYVEEHRSPQEIVALNHIDPKVVNWVIKRIHDNEYKRRQMPPGLRVSEKAFTIGRQFPIVQRWI